MKYIGIDLHHRFSQICVYDAGATEEKIYRLANDKLVQENFFMQLGNDSKIAGIVYHILKNKIDYQPVWCGIEWLSKPHKFFNL